MAHSTVITVECEDPTDRDWLHDRCLSAVEEVVAAQKDENRLDDEVVVHAERDD